MINSPIQFEVIGSVGRLKLNRPKALHALNLEMCQIMLKHLRAWADDPNISFVMIDHAPDTRGFCAGADIKMLAKSGAKDGGDSDVFFTHEYTLNAILKAYPKPVLAFIDGITMGGGVGISVHGAIRVATENTVFAMPETAIGLFPDAGGSWFLPRLKGYLGYWLGLTGKRLKARDVLAAGIATHFVESKHLPSLKARIMSDGITVLNSLDTSTGLTFADKLLEINTVFSKQKLEHIISALENGSEWARGQAQDLRLKSPLSMKLTLKLLQDGAAMTRFNDVMVMEYRVASRLVRTKNFQEGVRAMVVDKDNAPQWQPTQLSEISGSYVESFFLPKASGDLWDVAKI